MTELEKAIQDRMEQIRAEKQKADLELALQPHMLEKEAEDRLVKEQIDQLDAIIRQVNAIDPIVTTNNERYTVNCYSVATNVFGQVLGRLLGLVNVSSSMFTEERQTKFEAITKVPYLSWIEANEAFGSPAYFNKSKELVDAVDADIEELQTRIMSICIKLGLPTSAADKMTKANIDRYFANRRTKALSDQLAHEKVITLTANSDDNDDDYTIED